MRIGAAGNKVVVRARHRGSHPGRRDLLRPRAGVIDAAEWVRHMTA
jgi:hypothetical protein